MNLALKNYLSWLLMVTLMVTLMGTLGSAHGANQEAIKIRIGLKLFRSILAADIQIKSKQGLEDQLVLAILYKNNKVLADHYCNMLQKMGKGENQSKIRNIPIIVHTIDADHLELLSAFSYAGIYLVEDINRSAVLQIVNYGIKHHVISYSPFSGAVEQGISAGLSIGVRVRPYLNVYTLKQSELQLKTFFLKISKRYEAQ